MRANIEKERNGFTLLEALVASMILGMAVVALIAINTRCQARTRLNRQYEQAWQALDRQLTMIEAMGIEEFITQGIMEGEISNEAEEKAQTLYSWEVETQSEEIDNLYRVNITVRWVTDNKPHVISAATLSNGKGGGIL